MDVMEATKKINTLTDEMRKIADEYRQARCNYSTCKVGLNRLLSERIVRYQAEKKNLGVEMAIIKALGDQEYKNREEFDNNYKGTVYFEALYKGLERQLEAVQSQIMSIQSLLKYYRDGEMNYGS